MLSIQLTKRLFEAITDEKQYGQELISALNNSEAAVAQSAWTIPAAIIAAHVSETTDFAALAVGDLVVHIPASAGNAIFYSVATAGTLPAAAVVGDLYIVLRALSLPATTSIKL